MQEINLPPELGNLSRDKLMELRDQSGLSRQEFYLQYMGQADYKESVEIGNV